MRKELTAKWNRRDARGAGIRIIGPNTAGIVNSDNGMILGPYEPGYKKVKPGSVAICAQTGMINPQAFPYGTSIMG